MGRWHSANRLASDAVKLGRFGKGHRFFRFFRHVIAKLSRLDTLCVKFREKGFR
jgi:hypothetical protein